MQAWTSFRDPSGGVDVQASVVVRRFTDPVAAAEVRAFYATRAAQDLVASGRLIGTVQSAGLPAEASVTGTPDETAMLHPRIAFPSYPYEWPASMLHAAAALTVELAMTALDERYELKDASPFNILFNGSAPVFVDAASFRRRQPGRWLWPPLAQFEKSFLLPLLAHRLHGDAPHSLFLADSAGLAPESLAARVRGIDRLRPTVIRYASLPRLLGRFAAKRSGLYRAEHRPMPEAQAVFVLRSMFARLRRDLAALAPRLPASGSPWSGYAEDRPYLTAEFARKEAFVQSVLEGTRPDRVIDIGCNDGHFGKMAARSGAEVLAFDRDSQVIDALWRDSAKEKLRLLPLIIDLSRPSPCEGWRNAERPGFLDRVQGRFDVALFLACFHHVVVTDRIPVGHLLDFLASLRCRHIVFEYVDPADPMFQTLLRGRGALHQDLTAPALELELRRHFTISDSADASPTRRLYWLTRN